MAKITDVTSSRVPKSPGIVGGLGAKFVLLVIGILSITLGVATALTVQRQNALIESHLEEKGHLLGHFVSLISAEAILAYDFDSLNGYIKDVSQQNDMVYGVVLDTKNHPMTSYLDTENPLINSIISEVGRYNVSAVLQRLQKRDNIIHMSFPITVEDKKIATIVVGIGKERLYQMATRIITNQVLINVAIIAFLSLAIYLVFRYSALRPIRYLMQGSQRMAGGDLDTPVPVVSNDELGTLTQSFNDMMLRLGTTVVEKDNAMSQLSELNRYLEERVRRRTSALQRSETRIRAVLDNIGEAIIILDEDGFVESANPAAAGIFRCTINEIVGIHSLLLLADHYSDKYQHNDRYNDYREGPFAPDQAPTAKEFQGKRADGTAFPMELLVTQMQLNDEYMRICIARDISERKQTENELNRHRDHLEELVAERTKEVAIARDEAQQANRAKSAFLANMSHEIRTPLTAIVGFAEVSLDPQQSVTDRNEAIKTIMRNSQHLLQLINDILDLSKIEAKKFEIEHIELSPFKLLNELWALYQPQALEKGISFSVNYELPIPACVISDPLRIKQILLNLLSNAFKFTDSGHIKIRVSFDECNNLLCFDVIDSGIGMNKEQIGRVFENFTQADSSTTRTYGGTGLGLALSRSMAHMLGGSLSVKSEEGIGSSFSLTIDTGSINTDTLVTDFNFIESDNAEVSEQKYIKPLTGHALLAEDTIDNQRLIKWLLKKIGVEVTIANNGKEAIELALTRDFDLVLMDMQMPVVDGVTAVTQLRSKKYQKPIVALTANAMTKDKERCLAAGCNDFITKPVNRQRLYDVISKYLTNADTKNGNDTPIYPAVLDDNLEWAKMSREFASSLITELKAIKTAAMTEDWEAVEWLLHALKGKGGGFGYPIVTDTAAEAENHIKNRNYPATIDAIDNLLSIGERIYGGLQALKDYKQA
ncbi:MAG: ATP-binding protein [Gammaproteobacteria bacterium]|jgi:PAS domain S-box-containing protein